jgi:hypothetical protein
MHSGSGGDACPAGGLADSTQPTHQTQEMAQVTLGFRLSPGLAAALGKQH